MSEQVSPEARPRTFAYRAAKAFHLPEDWQVGRGEEITGVALDPGGALVVDDIIRFTGDNSSGEGIVHVGITDARLLYADPDLRETAEKRKRTTYRDSKAIRPMWPRPVSEKTFSLLPGQLRPLLGIQIPVDEGGIAGIPQFSYGMGRATAFSYEEADQLITTGVTSEGLMMNGAARAAQNLRAARLGGDARKRDFLVENGEGHITGTRSGVRISDFLTRQIMISVNGIAGKFMRENGIPLISRNCTLNNQRLADLGTITPEMIESGRLRAFWSYESLGHVILNLTDYAQITSPLWRLGDFINHVNLGAFFNGESYPYPDERTRPIGVSLTGRPRKSVPHRKRARAPQLGAQETAVSDSDEKLAGSEMNEMDLLAAIFYGTGETGLANAQAAVRALTHNATMSNSVVANAIDRGLITLRPSRPEDPGDTPMVAECAGSIYPYAPMESEMLTFHANTQLLGAIAGLTPEESRPVKAKLQRPPDLLVSLRTHRQLIYHCSSVRTGDNEQTCTAYVYVNGRMHTATATTETRARAERAAAGELVEQLDLLLNPPTEHIPEEEFREVWAQLAGPDAPVPLPANRG